VPRNHRKPGVIRVICTDGYHHDEPDFARLGHHYIGTLRLAYRRGFADSGFRWHGPREALDTIETRDRKLSMSMPGTPLTELPLPVKMWRTEDDKPVFRFRCTCGRDVQRHDEHLADVVRRWAEAKPDSPRLILEIARL
jgi:hypothetical protein